MFDVFLSLTLSFSCGQPADLQPRPIPKIDRPPPYSPLVQPPLPAWDENAVLDTENCRRLLPTLQRTHQLFQQHQLATLWRTATLEEQPIAHLQQLEDTLYAFAEKSIRAFDASSGTEKWSLLIDAAEPQLIPLAASTKALLIRDKEVLAIERSTGQIVWRQTLSAPLTEWVQNQNLIFVAGNEEVIALRIADGSVVWRYDPLEAPSSGPTLTRHGLALPTSTELQFLAAEQGQLKSRLALSDDIASPLFPLSLDESWVLLGGDRAALVNTATPALTWQTSGLIGASWPPVRSENIVYFDTEARPGRRSIAALDHTTKSLRWIPGQRPLTSAAMTGVVYQTERPHLLVFRDNKGRTLWQQRLKQATDKVLIVNTRVFAAFGPELFAWDLQSGQRQFHVIFHSPIQAVVFENTHGVVLLEDGSLNGVPSLEHPVVAHWENTLLRQRATCLLATNQAATALRALPETSADFVILDLRAQALQSLKRQQEAISVWAQLLEQAPPAHPSYMQAKTALVELVGLTKHIDFNRSTSGPDAEINSEEWAFAKKLVNENEAVQGTSPFRITEPPAIQYESVDHQTRWVQHLDHVNTRVLATSAQEVLLGDDSGAQQMLDLVDGKRRWLRPNAGACAQASIVAQRFLCMGDTNIQIFDTQDGGQLHTLKVPGAASIRVFADETGWWVLGEKSLEWLDAGTARFRTVMRLNTRISSLAISPEADAVLISTETHELLSFSRSKKILFNRIRWPGCRKLGAFQGHFYVQTSPHTVVLLRGEKTLGRAH